MKLTLKKICIALFAASALVFAGCSDSDDSTPVVVPTPEETPGDEGDTGGNSDVKDASISLTDAVTGYASLGTSYVTAGTPTTVTTKAELTNAISKGGIIIIDGMIDISEGMLPAVGSNSLTSTSALDTFVHNTKSTYANYDAWVAAYAGACAETTEDGDATAPSGAAHSSKYDDLWALNKAYGNKIKLTLAAGTTLIGKSSKCGIRGGSIQLNGVKNIIIRNLTIQDAYDPFPHHEVATSNGAYSKSDGYNAQWDGVNIQGPCENIWIDHCTFEDTIDLAYTTVTTKEKWQTYDGLCDIKNDTTNVTVSNCTFRNHDKTMLIGSDDNDGDNTKRFITLSGNYFYNCGQRLPMVRNTKIHIFNNYYDASNPHYNQQYAIGRRKNCIIYAENNYFGSGINASIKETNGELHSSGNSDNAKTKATTATDNALFSSLSIYTYTAVSADEAKTNALANAGAGYTLAL